MNQSTSSWKKYLQEMDVNLTISTEKDKSEKSDSPFPKKEKKSDKKDNPFESKSSKKDKSDNGDKKDNPFEKKSGKKDNPFEKKEWATWEQWIESRN